jgi:hypothetical protein
MAAITLTAPNQRVQPTFAAADASSNAADPYTLCARGKIMKLSVFLVSFMLVMVPVSFAAKSDSFMPQKFSAYIGGFDGRSYWVTLKGETIIYRASGVTPKEEKEFRPTQKEWAQFHELINKAGVWNWRSEYKKPVLDGTQWSLELIVDGKSKRIKGDNDFPAKDSFELFRKAVKVLVNGSEFR